MTSRDERGGELSEERLRELRDYYQMIDDANKEFSGCKAIDERDTVTALDELLRRRATRSGAGGGQVIAGGGFARMAWKAAQNRTFRSAFDVPDERKNLRYFPNCPHLEYYRILDRAWRFRVRRPYGIRIYL